MLRNWLLPWAEKNISQRMQGFRSCNILRFSFHTVTKEKKIIFVLFFFPVVGEACEYLREIGGLGFINDLAKSSVHGIVKEAALFTLGIIIESNGNKHY